MGAYLPQIIVYGLYALFLFLFIGLSLYAVMHTIKYSYLSRSILFVTWVYAICAAVLTAFSAYLVASLPL